MSVQEIAELLTHRLLNIPRLSEEPGAWRSTLADLRTAIVGMHAATFASQAPGGMACCWLRTRPRGQVAVLCGGPNLASPGHGGRTSLLFPPGASGRPMPEGHALTALSRFPVWVICGGSFDASDDANRRDEATLLAPGAREDCFTQMAAEPLCWLVVATPVPDSRLSPDLADLALIQPSVSDRSERALDLRLRAEREEAWFREVDRVRTEGMWDVRVLAGGRSEAVGRQLVALLGSGRDMVGLPYRLKPAGACNSLTDALAFTPAGDSVEAAGPFLASSELLAALARPPLRELPGMRAFQRPSFDVTAETLGPVRLGEVMDEALGPCGDFKVGTGTLNRHVFVCGATGAGKSQTVRTLLEQATAAGLRWLVVEPAKGEYRSMAARLGSGHRLAVIRPGAPDMPAVSLNPLEPSAIRSPRTGRLIRFPLQTHLDLVKSLFVAAFEAEEPFPQILLAALTRAYEDLGWNLALGESSLEGRKLDGERAIPRYPQLADLQRAARATVEAAGYGTEVMNNVKGFVDVRLGSLRLGSAGRFFEGGHSLDLPALLASHVVLELESIGDDQDKAFFIGTVLVRLAEHLRLSAAEGQADFRHLTVIEEAHRLLRGSTQGAAAHAVELFGSILAEIRAYGEGIVVAEQIPSKILPDVIKNTALKIMHRLPAADDRDVVGATMNLSEEQSEYVVALEPGWAVASADGMDRPVLVKVDNSGQALEAREALLADPPVDGEGMARAPCGRMCRRGRPCTLRELDMSRNLAQMPELVLWAELTVVAHLCGDTMPAAAGSFLTRLRVAHEEDWERLACAIGQRCHQAVDSRYAGLAERYQPEELATHASETLLRQVSDSGSPCERETRWLAGQFRWRDVVRSLEALPQEEPITVPPAWRRRGLVLRGRTPGILLREVARQSGCRLTEDELLHGVVAVPGLSVAERAARDQAGPMGLEAADQLWFLETTPRTLLARLLLRSAGGGKAG